jgi:hypothetical protein
MLNPRIYLEDCIRFTNHRQWRTIFPWQVIYDSIDNETFEYTGEDTLTFKRLTGHEWDPLEDKGLKMIRCPKCAVSLVVSWTQPPPVSSREALEAYLVFDTGFAGSEFRQDCSSCHLTITHEKLRVGKFCSDADALIEWDQPLAGTILNMWGEPAGTYISSSHLMIPAADHKQAQAKAKPSALTTPSSPTASSRTSHTCNLPTSDPKSPTLA